MAVDGVGIMVVMSTFLAITSNPEPHSLTEATAAAFLRGAGQTGADTQLLDLYGIGFDPVYRSCDRDHYLGRGPMPDDVRAIQSRLEGADVLALVFPVYWYTMPAMMKGLFDRVICRGFAYGEEGAPGALAGKTVRVIMLTGSSRGWYESDGVGQALQNQICHQTFTKYCGVTDVEIVYVDNLSMGDDAPRRRAAADSQLRTIEGMGARLAARA